jgi:LacI family transcriptional regulator
LIQAVEVVARRASWSLLLSDAQDDPAVEREVTEVLVARRVDALLISPCDRVRSRATIERFATMLPVVQLDRRCTPSVDYVGVDQKAAIAEIIEHLASRGRTRLAFVGMRSSEWTAFQRELAFRGWAKRNSEGAPIMLGESTVAWGEAAASQLFGQYPATNGVVCANDVIAFGVLLALGDMGKRVPEEVSVTGFDNSLSALARPQLTTVQQPVNLLAERAFDVAAKGASRGGAETMEKVQRIVVPPTVIYRNSS